MSRLEEIEKMALNLLDDEDDFEYCIRFFKPKLSSLKA